MRAEDIAAFNEAVAASPALQAKIRDIQTKAARNTAEKISALAGTAGLPFSADELLAEESPSTGELSDESLEAVAGGMSTPNAVGLSILTLGIGCAAAAIHSKVDASNPLACIK
jgi:predicted ribosomally synthesized peptide with nif11-like leader